MKAVASVSSRQTCGKNGNEDQPPYRKGDTKQNLSTFVDRTITCTYLFCASAGNRRASSNAANIDKLGNALDMTPNNHQLN